MDVWSAGCVLGELLLLSSLLPGRDGVDQLACIGRLLGAPTQRQLTDMLPSRPTAAQRRLADDFVSTAAKQPAAAFDRLRMGTEAVSLLRRMLVYSPLERYSAAAACTDRYFARLRCRRPAALLPDGRPLPFSEAYFC